METYDTRDNMELRQGKPRVVRLSLCGNHGYLTFSGECDCKQKADEFHRYAVIGTQYGYLHRTNGDIALWKSASGARHALKKYVPL